MIKALDKKNERKGDDHKIISCETSKKRRNPNEISNLL